MKAVFVASLLTAQVLANLCPDGWTVSVDAVSCICSFDGKASWIDALLNCNKINGSLASIHNAFTDALVYSKLSKFISTTLQPWNVRLQDSVFLKWNPRAVIIGAVVNKGPRNSVFCSYLNQKNPSFRFSVFLNFSFAFCLKKRCFVEKELRSGLFAKKSILEKYLNQLHFFTAFATFVIGCGDLMLKISCEIANSSQGFSI